MDRPAPSKRMIMRVRILPGAPISSSSMEEQRNPTPQARSSNLRVEPNTESYPGRAGSRPLSALCLHRHGDRALNSPPSGSGIGGCAPVFQTGEAGSMPAARSISPPSSTLVRMRLFQSCEAGSSPAGGPQDAGVRERPNRPAFEAEVRARARRTFESCPRCGGSALVHSGCS